MTGQEHQMRVQNLPLLALHQQHIQWNGIRNWILLMGNKKSVIIRAILFLFLFHQILLLIIEQGNGRKGNC